MSTDAERYREFDWASGRKADINEEALDHSRADKAMTMSSYSSPSSYSAPWPAWDDKRFVRALTNRELEFLAGYLRLVPSIANSIVQLNQNPESHATHNRGRSRLQTITRDNHMLLSLELGRWLTSRELLLAQAFPMLDLMGSMVEPGPCSFSVDRERFGFPPRRRNSMSEQVGNSMNVNAIGAAFLWLFGFTDYREGPQGGQRGQRQPAPSSGIGEIIAKGRREMPPE